MGFICKVSKLFRAYRLYNPEEGDVYTGHFQVSKLFRAYRLYNDKIGDENKLSNIVSKLFRAYRLYNLLVINLYQKLDLGFKALSSLQVI